MVDTNELDVVIVGAGFSGLYCLNKFRANQFKVKVYEAGSDLGGTWYWNRYPGARVDTVYSVYQFQPDDVLTPFEYKELYPDRATLQKYFHHVDSKLNVSRDIQFNTRVSSAKYCQSRNKWLVQTEGGESTWAKYLILCIGFASRRYTPPFKHMEKFKGECHHTSLWPNEGVDLKGKRVAVIGTGASGVQVIQEIGPEVAHLTVYQRTPNMALPMQQCTIEDTDKWKNIKLEDYKEIFENRLKSFVGIEFDGVDKCALEDTPEQWRSFFESLFELGGFRFWLGSYKDIIISKEANAIAYEFWREKTGNRINDPVKREILAPLIPPHPFGTKRCSLEQCYYEVFNQNNVDIIDVKKSPIIEMTEEGIISENEGLTKFDVIVLATGFDSYTGGFLDIRIENGKGESLNDKWKNGTWSHLGMTTADFPNMFWLYGPQAPTAFTIGPTLCEIQGNWLLELFLKMREENLNSVQATKQAEEEWKKEIDRLWNASLCGEADSWYQGANIPGKPREALNYNGGIPMYIKTLQDCKNNNYQGFILA